MNRKNKEIQPKNISIETEIKYAKKSQSAEIWRRFRRNKSAVVGLIMLIILISLAIFSPIIATHDPLEQNLLNRLKAPTKEHILGTDELGRDVFSRIVYGSRISISVGLIAVGIAFLLGSSLGSIGGFFGGRIDNIIMRIMDIFMAIPQILLAIAIVSALGPGLQNMMVAIGISTMPRYCRVMRGAVLSVREQEFIEASRATGASDFYIITQHIIPNSMAPMIIQISMSVGTAILSCASLSFLGLGIVPPTPEWGSMLSTGRDFLRHSPHVCTFPGIAIMFAIYAMNLIGDGLRDALDPKLKD